MGKSKIKKRKTFSLKLTKFELVHLRDLCSIALPPDLKQTISQALAVAEDRAMVETVLWNKLVTACREAKLPLDDDAPDFICAASGAPPVGVFRLAQEQNEGQQEVDEGVVFEDEEEDEVQEEDEDEEVVEEPVEKSPRQCKKKCRTCEKH